MCGMFYEKFAVCYQVCVYTFHITPTSLCEEHLDATITWAVSLTRRRPIRSEPNLTSRLFSPAEIETSPAVIPHHATAPSSSGHGPLAISPLQSYNMIILPSPLALL
jgi:hypothetical protein